MKNKLSWNEKHEITVEKLSWRPAKNEPYILKNIECVLEKGNIYGIIGPNGSGKSSFVKNLLRFVGASEGVINIDDINIRVYKRKNLAKKLALVPQNTNMDSAFTVYDIVMMGRTPYQKRFCDASKEDDEIVLEAMKITDCYDFKDKEVFLLSGGEAQRVAIARAIAQDTEWLILDEPTASLDVKHQVELMSSLVKLNGKKNKTIIAVLHDINIASTYCNKIIMMKDGRIHSQGNTEEVLTKENLTEVYEINFDIIKNSNSRGRYFIPYR